MTMTNEPAGLEADYGGDEGWRGMASHFAEVWDECPNKEQFIEAAQGNLDIAQGVWALSNDIEHFNYKVPVLGNLSPKECFERLPHDVALKRLRQWLWRCPWT